MKLLRSSSSAGKIFIVKKKLVRKSICYQEVATRITHPDQVAGVAHRKDVTIETMDGCDVPSEINTVCLTGWSQ